MRRVLTVLLLVALLGAAGVFLVTTRAGVTFLLWSLERQSSPVDPQQWKGVDAIAVLGGRTARIDHAARLHLATGVPILLTGKGTGDSGFAAESEKMEDILLRRYGVGPRWVEMESRNTHQNAVYSWCLVAGMGVRRVALVTDAYHFPRARAEFRAAGFEVVPAPIGDPSQPRWQPPFGWTRDDFRPGGVKEEVARHALREWGGFLAATASRLLPAPRCR